MLSVIAALVVGWQIAAFAAAGISGTFESNDGNKTKETHDDWLSVTNPSDLVEKNDDPSGALDRSFGQGTKEDTPQPTVVNGSIPPNKSDLTKFGIYTNKGSETPVPHDYLYMYWERSNTLGSANMDFEFNQKECVPSATPTNCANNGPDPDGNTQNLTPIRSAGDILVTFDFASGGNVVQLGLLKWVTSGANSQCEANGATTAQGCWGNRVDLDASGNADGAVSADQKFGEAAIDLTDTVFGDSCAFLGSAYLKSRSSDSFTAALKDFVPPTGVDISNCGKIIIDKVTNPNPDPSNTSFNFKLNGGPTTQNLDKSFSLTNSATPFDSGPILPSGSTPYVAAETTPLPPGWQLTSSTCSDGSLVSAINLSAGETVTCTFTNTKLETNISTEQSFTPQDKANISGFGGAFSGKIDFELYKGTACTGTPVYFERNVTVNLPSAGGSVSTTNGAAATADHSAQYDIVDGTKEGDYRWKVSYHNDANHPNFSSCVEASNVTINNSATP
jgi:hypothetical protein